jgi:hypothetical protein
MKKPLLILTSAYVASRLILLFLAGVFLSSSGYVRENWEGNLHLERSNPAWIEALYRWDACWYLEIAEFGYTSTRGHLEDQKFGAVPFSAGFFPLFPYAIQALKPLAGTYEIAGILAGLLGGWLAVAGLFLLARSALDEDTAFRAALLLLFFPSSLFLSLPFSEGFFLGFLCLGFLAMQKNFTEGLPALALAVITRPLGLFLPASLAFARRPWGMRVRALAAWALGLGLLLLVFHAALGGLEPFFERQSLSRGMATGPWRFLIEYFRWEPKGWFSWKGGHLDLALALLSMATLALGPRKTKLPLEWNLWGWVAVLVPLCSSLLSFQRLLLPAFPLFIYWTGWLPRRAFWAALALSASAQIYFLYRYATFQWIA